MGGILYTQPIDQFNVQVTAGLSKPLVGDANTGRLTLSNVAVTGAAAGTLAITLSDTDFTVPAGSGALVVESAVGGTTPGSTTFQSYVNSDNSLYGTSGATGGLQGPLTGAFDDTANFSASFDGPFSMTQVAIVTVGPGQVQSFGADTIATGPALQPARLGDFVWDDLDGDGIQDAGRAWCRGCHRDIDRRLGQRGHRLRR